MTQPQPHEPVSFRYEMGPRITSDFRPRIGPEFTFSNESPCMGIDADWSAHVTLANGQKIIVRALSEERKAARMFERRVKQAVEANR